MTTTYRRLVSIALAALVLTALTGCSGLQGTEQANFVTGDASILTVEPADREQPVVFGGTSLQGEPVDVTDFRGEVVVVNFWGSWCNPCREEMPILREASQTLDAAFLGVLIRDQSLANARAFEREFGITYPTIADGSDALLSLGRYTPTSPPTTVVLDPEGRVAAAITGAIPSTVTLEDVVAQAGSAGASAGGSADG